MVIKNLERGKKLKYQFTDHKNFYTNLPQINNFNLADDATRTRDLELGRFKLYQLSYIRIYIILTYSFFDSNRYSTTLTRRTSFKLNLIKNNKLY